MNERQIHDVLYALRQELYSEMPQPLTTEMKQLLGSIDQRIWNLTRSAAFTETVNITRV